MRPRTTARFLPALAAVVTGLLLTAAFPGPDLGAIALVAMVPLLVAVEGLRPLRAARLGFLAGAVFFGIHLTWIATFGFLAWGGLCAAESLAVAAFFAVAAGSRRLGALRLLVLPACWAALEMVRGHVPLGGFPWAMLGLSQHDGGLLLPLARVVGTYGLSALLVAVNVALAEVVLAAVGRRATGAPALRRRSLARAAGWIAVAALLPALGLLAPAAPPATGKPLRLVVIQGNVPADRQDRGATTEAVFENHVRLTEALAGGPKTDLVIWPEGAVDEDPFLVADRHARITAAAVAAGAPVLTGATTDRGDGTFATEALEFAPDGRLLARYTKRRLVPFGEYVPGGAIMRTLVPATAQVAYDKRPGHRLDPIDVAGVPVGTIICWETAFPEDARRLTAEGAQVILAITNNASYGYSPASLQHLATSQLRAVEDGRTVVHAAISGISAIVTPDGKATQTTRLFEQATVRATVVPSTGLTFYVRHGAEVDRTLAAVALLGLLGAALPRRRGRVAARPRRDHAAPPAAREPVLPSSR